VIQEKIVEGRELQRKARPGPWTVDVSKYVRGRYVIDRENRTVVHATGTVADPDNAEYVAWLGTNASELFDRLEHLEERFVELLKLADRMDARGSQWEAYVLRMILFGGSDE
jgi:hypothetical protein